MMITPIKATALADMPEHDGMNAHDEAGAGWEAENQRISRPWRVMVVSPYAHGGGHYPVFARDLSVGFARCGARVALLHPRPIESSLDFMGEDVRRICLTEGMSVLPLWLRSIWPRLQPIHQCLAWLMLEERPDDWDLIYWTDLDPGNQRRLWPISLARLVGLYRFRTAFSEHHTFTWRRPVSRRLHRYLSLDQRRLADFDMFVHSHVLLAQIRGIMESENLGRYVPWGLWPAPASAADRIKARASLGISPDARVLLVFGWQAVYRKNLDALAKAARYFTDRVNLTLLFVGKHKESEPHPFKEGVWNVDVRFDQDFVSEQRTRNYFEACDGVWANYRGFLGASGVLQQAMSHGRLTLCQSSGEIGDLCRQHDLGLIVPSEGEGDFNAALDWFISLSADEQERYEANARSAASRYDWSMIAQDVLREVQARESGVSPKDTPHGAGG